MWVLREIMPGYKGVSGGKGESGDVDVSGTSGYGVLEFLDKLDGIADKKSEFTILVLRILVAIFYNEMYTHFDQLL